MQNAIPRNVIALMVDIAVDPLHRRYRGTMLAPEAGSATPELADALASPSISVRADVCRDDPNEVCVMAYGRDRLGRVWPSTPIIMLDPEWDRDAEMAQALADDFVQLWDRVQTAAARQVIA